MTRHISLLGTSLMITLFLPFGVALAQNVSDADREKMLENVVQADTNQDGALSAYEFETLMKLNADDKLGRAAQVVKSGRYTMVFKRVDANGDGFLTREEMQAMSAQARG